MSRSIFHRILVQCRMKVAGQQFDSLSLRKNNIYKPCSFCFRAKRAIVSIVRKRHKENLDKVNEDFKIKC